MRIDGQMAVVAGGASGLGEATARLLAERGATVVVVDRDAARGEKVAATVGGAFFAADVADEAAVEAAPSVAAYHGQTGQVAYAASKGGVVAMTLPAARDLAVVGIRVCTVVPGLMDTPLAATMPAANRQRLEAQSLFPHRFGRPDEFALLVAHIVENPYLNAECIRLDGGLRLARR